MATNLVKVGLKAKRYFSSVQIGTEISKELQEWTRGYLLGRFSRLVESGLISLENVAPQSERVGEGDKIVLKGEIWFFIKRPNTVFSQKQFEGYLKGMLETEMPDFEITFLVIES